MGVLYRLNAVEKTDEVVNAVLLLEAKTTEPMLLEGQEKLRGSQSFPERIKTLQDHFYLEIVPDENRPHKAVVRAFDALKPLLHDYIVDRNGLNNRIDTFLYKPNAENRRPHPDLEPLEKIARSGMSWSIEKGEWNYTIRPIQRLSELTEFENASGNFCFFRPQENLAQLYLYAAHQSTQLLGIWKNEEPFGILPLLLMQTKEGFQVLYLEAMMSLAKTTALEDEEKVMLVEGMLDLLPEYTALLRRDPYFCIGDSRKTGRQYDPLVKGLVDTAAQRFSNKIKIKEERKYPEPDGTSSAITVANHDGLVDLELTEDRKLLSYLQQHGYPFSSIFMFSQAFLQDKNWQKRRLWKEWGEMKGKSKVLPDIFFHQYFVQHLREHHDPAKHRESNLVCG